MQSCLIADDHELVREALAATLRRRWPAATISEAGDFTSAWKLAAAAPQLCLVDLDMPDASPLAGVDRLRTIAPTALIVIVTGASDDETMLALLERGVAGIVDKRLTSALLIAALELVLAGGRYLPARLADLHLERRVPAAPPRRALSERQAEVARLIALGLSNKDIARELAVSPATVKTHVAQLIAATGAANRTDAVIRARDSRLL